MPSPFPGMDPFIEDQRWRDFHATTLSTVKEFLVPDLRPRYVVDIEDYVYVMTDKGDVERPIGPDLSIRRGSEFDDATVEAAGASTIDPVLMTLPQPDEITEHYLVIRNREWNEIVTIVELLSPTNKHPGRGRRQYLAKRENLFEANDTHLVEIDLLRGGNRLPTEEPLPPGDYFAFVCRTEQYRMAEVYPWSLRDPLPKIPVPLANGDPDVSLDLQQVFDLVYDRSGYDYALDYAREVAPRLDEESLAWVRERLASRPKR